MGTRYALALLVLGLGCSQQNKGIKYGVTTVAELKAAKGEPQSIQPTTDKIKEQVLVYPGDEKYQIEKDVVTASFRNPLDEERSLLYWRHKFRKCETTYQEIASTGEEHTPAQMELKCAAEGVSVVYEPHADAVIRVVEYAR